MLDRVGFGGRAVLYGVVGTLATRIAVGLPGGEEVGAQGAIEAISELPTGAVGLVALAAGLVAFGVWSGLQAFHPRSDLRITERVTRAAQAIAYGAIALLAVRQVFGGGGGGGGSSATATLLGHPAGRVLVGAVGVALLVVAGRQVWRAWTDDLREELDTAGHRIPSWWRMMGRVGYAGRGLAYGLVGVFVVQAAVAVDPDSVTGLDVALDELARTGYGRVAVAAVAGGLLAIAGWFALAAWTGVEAEVEADDAAPA